MCVLLLPGGGGRTVCSSAFLRATPPTPSRGRACKGGSQHPRSPALRAPLRTACKCCRADNNNPTLLDTYSCRARPQTYLEENDTTRQQVSSVWVAASLQRRSAGNGSTRVAAVAVRMPGAIGLPATARSWQLWQREGESRIWILLLLTIHPVGSPPRQGTRAAAGRHRSCSFCPLQRSVQRSKALAAWTRNTAQGLLQITLLFDEKHIYITCTTTSSRSPAPQVPLHALAATQPFAQCQRRHCRRPPPSPL